MTTANQPICPSPAKWPSPAKLNLFLYITGQRADGYHQLQTLFQFLDYGDQLTIEPRDDNQIRLLTPIAGVENEQNLIVRAAKMLQKHPGNTPVPRGADISIDKCLPMGGGLGGGSSNAATVLVALNLLWQCGLTDEQLADLGLTLGADVPVLFGAMPPSQRVLVKITASRACREVVFGHTPRCKHPNTDYFLILN